MTSKTDNYVISINLDELASDTSESSDDWSDKPPSKKPNILIQTPITTKKNNDE